MAQILVFGDSIADGAFDPKGGWVDRLKQYFMQVNIDGDVVNDESHWVYNLGISGNLTDDILERIETEAKARKVDRKNKRSAFVFAIGINDSCLKGDDKPLPRSDESKFTENYTKLVNYAKKYTDKIICVGLTPVNEKYTSPIYDLYWYNNERISSFNEVVMNIARENMVEFVDLYQHLITQPNFKYLLIDGLHPNENGHKLIFELLKPLLVKALRTD